MKFFILFLFLSTVVFSQQEEKKDSPLVEAAKKTGRYKMQSGISITNKDLQSAKKEEGKEIKKEGKKLGTEEVLPLQEEEMKDSKGRTKKDWQILMSSAKENVKILEEKVRELQSKLNKLTNDYYAWDDVAYREGVIKVEMDKTREQLDTAKAQLEEAKKKVSELEEEARKSGALPGWLR